LALGFYKNVAPTALRNIAKGFRHSAQRCRDEGTATLGNGAQIVSALKELQQMATGGYNPIGIEDFFGR
jgi:hypothetical protein